MFFPQLEQVARYVEVTAFVEEESTCSGLVFYSVSPEANAKKINNNAITIELICVLLFFIFIILNCKK